MNKLVLVSLIIIGILVLTNLVLTSGISKKVEEATKTETRPLISSFIQLDESNMILQWIVTARGDVKQINNRTVTITNDSTGLVIPMREDATFVRSILGVGGEVSLTDIELEDIKIGDMVIISTKVNPNGSLEGIRIRILP